MKERRVYAKGAKGRKEREEKRVAGITPVNEGEYAHEVRSIVTNPGKALLAVLLSAALLHGNPQATETTHSQEKTNAMIRANTRMVQLNVVVLDRQGNPVTGLAKEDFTVLDGGAAQEIAQFAQEGGGGARLTENKEVLPPNVYTNEPRAESAPGDVTVVLLDELNTLPEDRAYTRKQVVKLLASLRPEDHVALYVLASNLYVLHDFTHDMRALIELVRNYQDQLLGQGYSIPEPMSLPRSDNPDVKAMKDFMDISEQKRKNLVEVNRAEATIGAFEAIAQHLAPIPGRKNLVWVSESFPLGTGMQAPSRKFATLDVRGFDANLERATRLLNQANIVVYPVDARGLTTLAEVDATKSIDLDPDRDRGNEGSDQDRTRAAMDILADRTGGRAQHNNNDLTGAVRKALSEGRVSYSLAFYPTHGKWDGKYRTLTVRVNRPGVQLSYRRGYFATAGAEETDAEGTVALAAAVASPVDARSLRLRVEVDDAANGDAHGREMKLRLDLRQILFVDTQTGKNAQVDFLFVQEDAEGKQVTGEEKKAEFDFTRERYEGFLKTGLPVTHHLEVADGATQVKIVVRDKRSGAMGSLSAPLHGEGGQSAPAKS